MQHLHTLLALLLTTLGLHAQPAIQWQKCLGGTNSEFATDIQQTTDDGFIVVGYTNSYDGDVWGHHGGGDWWVVKLGPLGNTQWKRTLGGTSTEVAQSVRQTSDGGYIVAGHTYSSDGDVSGNHGDWDWWIVKLNALGQVEWTKTLGGSDDDSAYAVSLTTDGGYIVAGYAYSSDGDVTHKVGIYNIWIVKLDSLGEMEWNRSYGGHNGELAYSIQQTTDGGYVFAGETYSNDGDVSGNHGNSDCWVVKIDQHGAIEWQRALGGIGADRGWGVVQTIDGGYAMVGYAGSPDGDVTGWQGFFDYWVVKLSASGEIEWQRTLGGTDDDYALSICHTKDEGYVVLGTTRSFDGDVLLNRGQDIWAVKLSSTGEIEWQKTLGGSEAEVGRVIIQTKDGGFAIAGETYSNDGDVSGNHGSRDFWVVKLAPESVGTGEALATELGIYPNPASNRVTVSVQGLPEGVPLWLSVSDQAGRGLIRQTLPNGQTLDINTLPRGLYILSATHETGAVYTGKIIKTE